MSDGTTIYVVTAYKWGLRDNHSYVVGAYTDLEQAKCIADSHVEYRGNKYGCEVTSCVQNDNELEDGNDELRMYYVECPYFGNGVGMRSSQPVDSSKWLEGQEILGKIKDREYIKIQSIEHDATRNKS